MTGCASSPTPSYSLSLSDKFSNAYVAEYNDSQHSTWWRAFGDDALVELVERALENNHNIAIAVQRVQIAKAGLNAQASRLLPAVSLQGSASRSNSGLPEAVKQSQPDTRTLRLGLDLSWEIDLAGGVRAARDAASADASSAEAGVAGAQLMVASEVARQYFIWRSAEEQLSIVQALARAQRDTARLVESRVREGQSSAFDLDRARADADALDAQTPPLRTLIGVSQNRLAVLIGQNPSAPLRKSTTLFVWPAILIIAPGQPSELLRRRPDLLAAELRFAAETLRTQEARAQWWPKLFLSALTGRQDLQINALDLSPVRYSNVALALAAPIFNAGRIEAGIQAQSARATEALLLWRQSVLVAVQEVEDSLLAQAQEQQRADALAKTLMHRRQALQHAQALRSAGQIDLLTMLDVQRSVLAAELAMSASRLQQQLDVVQLFKALGGGFQVRAEAVVLKPVSVPAPYIDIAVNRIEPR
jgi:NodT family efflux transporter outer membrane factor (OMF) lipoprotein